MDDDELFNGLSERLRLAQVRLRSLVADADTKAAVAQRLIAITNAAKHDLGTASERLDALNAELDARDAESPAL
jgi:Skp family chaperone for outer membrane proteins